MSRASEQGARVRHPMRSSPAPEHSARAANGLLKIPHHHRVPVRDRREIPEAAFDCDERGAPRPTRRSHPRQRWQLLLARSQDLSPHLLYSYFSYRNRGFLSIHRYVEVLSAKIRCAWALTSRAMQRSRTDTSARLGTTARGRGVRRLCTQPDGRGPARHSPYGDRPGEVVDAVTFGVPQVASGARRVSELRT
jgi:hypothetical protein